MMQLKKFNPICLLSALLLFTVQLTGCASKTSRESDKEAPEPPALFDDWQYKGFGVEYPLWCEAVILEKGNAALAEFFPVINNQEYEVVTNVIYGNDLDMITHIAMEQDLDETGLLAKSWVRINPIYQEYDYSYSIIRIYLRQPLSAEDLL